MLMLAIGATIVGLGYLFPFWFFPKNYDFDDQETSEESYLRCIKRAHNMDV